MKKTFILIIAVITLAFSFSACKKTENTEPYIPVIPVASLLSLTGNWSSLGINSRAALEVATQDINAYLDGKNAGFRIGVAYGDTKLDTTLAKTLFAQVKANNIHFIIGPQSSAELSAIKPLVDASEIIVVSQSSTAGKLAIAGDAIFRFCPSDKIEGAAIAKTIYDSGIRGLVTVARNDDGNKGLQLSTGAVFTERGGEVSAITPYGTSETTDFVPVVAAIKAEVIKLKAAHGSKEKVGVYLASFDETTNLFKIAATEPELADVKWFGGDGIVQNTILTGDAAAADFAIATGFFAPAYGLSPAYQSKWKPIADRIKAITKTEPDAFALVTYDALWTIARTIEASNSTTADTFAQLKALFTLKANENEGITGPDGLNEAGDRADGTFDYWGITKSGSTYSWIVTGKSNE